MAKCLNEYNPNDTETILKARKLVTTNVSFIKTAELLGLEVPTVSLYVSDYSENKEYVTASRMGLTSTELEIEITKKFLEGKSLTEIARHFKIDHSSTKRYFMRCIRRNLKPEDLI